MIMSALPGQVIGFAPEPPIVGRAGIGKERHWIVRPDAGGPHLVTPPLNHLVLILRAFDQVGLYERNVALGFDQSISELVRCHLAALGKCRTSFDGEALD